MLHKGVVVGVVALAVAAVGPVTLDLYDVQDITYSINDWPSVDISLTGTGPDLFQVNYLLGSELADSVRPLVRDVEFQNGLLIVRARPLGHAAVRTCIAAHRARIRTLEGLKTLATRRSIPY